MDFINNGGIWKMGVLALAALMNYGAGFISKKLSEDTQKQTMIKMVCKIIAFVLAVFAAVAVMFL